VKGAISIKCEKKTEYSLINKMDTSQLFPEEKEVYDIIFPDNKLKETEVKVGMTNNIKFSVAKMKHGSNISKEWGFNVLFRDNIGKILLGFLIVNVVSLLYIFLSSNTEDVAYSFAVSSLFVALQIYAIIYAVFSTADYVDKTGNIVMSVLAACIFTFIYVGVVFEIATDFKIDDLQIHLPSVLFFSLISLLYFIYICRMTGYNEDGAKLAAELEGFKMYLKTAEEHRLNILTPPELFEKLLPYAMALGVSNEWCNKFGDVLKKFNYSPAWYNDNNLNAGIGAGLSAVAFTAAFTALSTSFGSSVSSASVWISAGGSSDYSSGSGSWSSGSSGGGSSGGGGGGGRVGGW